MASFLWVWVVGKLLINKVICNRVNGGQGRIELPTRGFSGVISNSKSILINDLMA